LQFLENLNCSSFLCSRKLNIFKNTVNSFEFLAFNSGIKMEFLNISVKIKYRTFRIKIFDKYKHTVESLVYALLTYASLVKTSDLREFFSVPSY
jgi:hypothetical protein